MITESFPNTSVISFDPPGFGDNARLQAANTVDDYVKLILRSLDTRPDIVIGHSIDARFVQCLGAKTDFKEILIDPTPDYLLDTT